MIPPDQNKLPIFQQVARYRDAVAALKTSVLVEVKSYLAETNDTNFPAYCVVDNIVEEVAKEPLAVYDFRAVVKRRIESRKRFFAEAH